MDHYRTLGVERTATPKEIKKAWRKLALKLHPDRSEIRGLSPEAEKGVQARFKLVQEAYGVLSDEKSRQEYDAETAPKEKKTKRAKSRPWDWNRSKKKKKRGGTTPPKDSATNAQYEDIFGGPGDYKDPPGGQARQQRQQQQQKQEQKPPPRPKPPPKQKARPKPPPRQSPPRPKQQRRRPPPRQPRQRPRVDTGAAKAFWGQAMADAQRPGPKPPSGPKAAKNAEARARAAEKRAMARAESYTRAAEDFVKSWFED